MRRSFLPAPAALVLLSKEGGDPGSLPMVVLLIATTTPLISYLIIVPTLIALRHRYPNLVRP